MDRRQGEDLEFFNYPSSRVRLPDDPRHRKDDFSDIINRVDENMNDERFRKYMLLFEEGEEFYDLPALLKLIAEGRKFFLQVVTVSPQAAPPPFAEVCRPMRPTPIH